MTVIVGVAWWMPYCSPNDCVRVVIVGFNQDFIFTDHHSDQKANLKWVQFDTVEPRISGPRLSGNLIIRTDFGGNRFFHCICTCISRNSRLRILTSILGDICENEACHMPWEAVKSTQNASGFGVMVSVNTRPSDSPYHTKDILKDSTKWLSVSKDSSDVKSFHKAQQPHLEEALHLWFSDVRSRNATVSDEMLIGKARELGTELGGYNSTWYVISGQYHISSNTFISYPLETSALSTTLCDDGCRCPSVK